MSYTPPLEAEVTAFVTTTPLAAAATFDSGMLDAAGITQVQTEIKSDQNGTIEIEFCEDAAGLNIVRSLSIPYTAPDYQFFAAPAFVNFIRYKFTNTSGVLNTFYYTTKFLTTALSPQLLTTNAFIAEAMVTSLGRNLLVGQNDGGQFKNVRIDNQQHLEVNASNPKTAYDELPVANYSPVAQISFPYNINTDIVSVTETAGGTVIQDFNMAVLNTSATTASSATVTSIAQIPFRAGQGHIGRLSCLFDGVPTSTGYMGIGLGDADNGYGFLLDSAAFNIAYRTNGVPQPNIPQTTWNVDKMDGTGPSGMTLDITKGNAYQISYGDGFGCVNFSIESASTGDYVLVHILLIANLNITPSAYNPTLPLRAEVSNGGGTADLTLSVASMSGFIEGENVIESTHGVINSLGGSVVSINTPSPVGNDDFEEETQIITYYNKEDVFGGTGNNKVYVKILGLNLINDTNKTAIIRIRENAVGIGLGVPTDVDSNASVMAYNIGQPMLAGGIVSGKIILELFAEKDGKSGAFVNVSDLNLIMTPGKSYTVSIHKIGTAATGGAKTGFATMLWAEDF